MLAQKTTSLKFFQVDDPSVESVDTRNDARDPEQGPPAPLSRFSATQTGSSSIQVPDSSSYAYKTTPYIAILLLRVAARPGTRRLPPLLKISRATLTTFPAQGPTRHPKRVLLRTLKRGSVRRRVGVLGRREPDARVVGVEHGVEALHEEVAVDEVEAGAALAADLRPSVSARDMT